MTGVFQWGAEVPKVIYFWRAAVGVSIVLAGASSWQGGYRSMSQLVLLDVRTGKVTKLNCKPYTLGPQPGETLSPELPQLYRQLCTRSTEAPIKVNFILFRIPLEYSPGKNVP